MPSEPRIIEGFLAGSKLREGEVTALLNLVPKDRQSLCLEIGCYAGVTSAIICKARPQCTMVCIDISPAYKEFKYNKQPNQFLFVGDSRDVLKIFTKQFDVIFIDGDHGRNGVLADLNSSVMLIKDGGIICGHDYDISSCPDVKPTVDEWCKQNGYQLIVLAGSLYTVRKS